MKNRKAALVGCRNGHWIRTNGMRDLRLDARVHQSTMMTVSQQLNHQDVVDSIFVGPGLHQLRPAIWTKIRIVDGPHEGALCLLEGAA